MICNYFELPLDVAAAIRVWGSPQIFTAFPTFLDRDHSYNYSMSYLIEPSDECGISRLSATYWEGGWIYRVRGRTHPASIEILEGVVDFEDYLYRLGGERT